MSTTPHKVELMVRLSFFSNIFQLTLFPCRHSFFTVNLWFLWPYQLPRLVRPLPLLFFFLFHIIFSLFFCIRNILLPQPPTPPAYPKVNSLDHSSFSSYRLTHSFALFLRSGCALFSARICAPSAKNRPSPCWDTVFYLSPLPVVFVQDTPLPSSACYSLKTMPARPPSLRSNSPLLILLTHPPLFFFVVNLPRSFPPSVYFSLGFLVEEKPNFHSLVIFSRGLSACRQILL